MQGVVHMGFSPPIKILSEKNVTLFGSTLSPIETMSEKNVSGETLIIPNKTDFE
jgi:hypothetical protein